jgi:biopolymer transport protein ExbB
MDTLIGILNDSIYWMQGILALWGLYCLILVWRRVRLTSFDNEDEQEEFLSEFHQAISNKNYDGATELCEDDRRALPQLGLFAIANRELAQNTLRARIAERFQQDVLSDIEHRMSWVNTAIKAAPMLGLLGTVMGMIGAFANLSSGEKVDTIQMAEDIQFALITTAVGLFIALPLIIASASVNIRIRKMEDMVGLGVSRLFEYLHLIKA